MAGIEGLCEEAQKCMGRVGTLSDFTLLTADGSQFSASKALLAANSEVFGKMFADLSADERSLQVEETAEEVICLLNHSYAWLKYPITAKNVTPCVNLAAKYDMPRLQDACEDYLRNVNLAASTLPAYLAVALDYRIAFFTERCLVFAAARLQQIIDDRIAQEKPPTDWLEALPADILVDIMQRRARVVSGLAAGSGSRFCRCHTHRTGGHACRLRGTHPFTDAEIAQLEPTY